MMIKTIRNAPLVSVIVPAYNAAFSINRALKSIQIQTLTDWEAIVVDDGSTDETEKIVCQYARQDSRFKLYSQKNMGVSAARNIGLTHSSGKWITFLDSDDLLEPAYLEKLIRNTDTNIDIVFAGAKTIGKNENIFKNQNTTVLHHTNIRNLCLSIIDNELHQAPVCNLPILGCVWSKLYRRTSLYQIQFDTRIAMREDAIFNIEAFCHSRAVAISTDCNYLYNSGYDSASVVFHPNFEVETSAFLEHCNAIWKREGFPIESLYHGMCYLYMTWLKLFALHPHNGFTYLEMRSLIRESFRNPKWRMAFTSVSPKKLNLPYKLLQIAYLSENITTIVALKTANDIKNASSRRHWK